MKRPEVYHTSGLMVSRKGRYQLAEFGQCQARHFRITACIVPQVREWVERNPLLQRRGRSVAGPCGNRSACDRALVVHPVEAKAPADAMPLVHRMMHRRRAVEWAFRPHSEPLANDDT